MDLVVPKARPPCIAAARTPCLLPELSLAPWSTGRFCGAAGQLTPAWLEEGVTGATPTFWTRGRDNVFHTWGVDQALLLPLPGAGPGVPPAVTTQAKLLLPRAPVPLSRWGVGSARGQGHWETCLLRRPSSSESPAGPRGPQHGAWGRTSGGARPLPSYPAEMRSGNGSTGQAAPQGAPQQLWSLGQSRSWLEEPVSGAPPGLSRRAGPHPTAS